MSRRGFRAKSPGLGRFGALVAVGVVVLLAAPPAWAATWREMETPNIGRFDNSFWGSDALSARAAWAVGYADTGTLPISRPVIQRWNGSRWSLVPNPLPDGGGQLRDVDALTPSSAWAVGWENTSNGSVTLTERWNGSEWTIVPSPSPSAQNYLLGVKSFSPNDAWAVGTRNVPNTLFFMTMVQHWNGSSWQMVPAPSPGVFDSELLSVDGVSPDDMWAVGYANDAEDGVRRPLAIHWDGSSWTSAPMPPTRDAGLNGVVAIAPDDVWAVGFSFSLQQLQQVPYALHWDGSSWKSVPIPASIATGGNLSDVTALSPTNVYAIGQTTSEEGDLSLAMRWDGTEWTAESTPTADQSILWDVSAVGANRILGVGGRREFISGTLYISKTFAYVGFDG